MAIRDQGYTRYEGDLSKGSPPAWVIATTEFSVYWSYLRTKLLFIVMMIVPVVFLIFSFGERVMTKMLLGGGGAEKISGFYEYAFGYAEVWLLAIMLTAAGCGVIADDMRHRTIQLYFSKPITRFDYVLGKFLSLVLLGGLVTILPMVVVGAVRLVVFMPSDNFKEVAGNVGMLALFNVALLVLFSLLVMALSCLTTRRGFVMLSWLGMVLVPSVVSTIIGVVRPGDAWTELLSMVGSLAVALRGMVGYSRQPLEGLAEAAAPEYMAWVPWLIVLALAGAAAAVIHWRTSKLEGIA